MTTHKHLPKSGTDVSANNLPLALHEPVLGIIDEI
jgi:hypothetical protein